MINLIAKKKIGFRNGDTQKIVTAQPLEYASLPDWIKNDPMYEWAKADGTITVASEEVELKKTLEEAVEPPKPVEGEAGPEKDDGNKGGKGK